MRHTEAFPDHLDKCDSMKVKLRSWGLSLALILGCGNLWAQTRVIGQTPQKQADYAQGVSGHAAALLSGTKGQTLLMLGGCNFPEVPARLGGKKRYYAEIYGVKYKAGKSIRSWRLLGRMPQPFAYAAYQTYDNALIVAGGKSEYEDLSSVYRLSLNEEGELQQTRLADLPAPRSGMASAIVGTRLYLIGGAVSGRLSNSMISLDLSNPSATWQEEAAYPSEPHLKVLSTSLGRAGSHGIYLFASFINTESDNLPVETDMCVMHYDPSKKVWGKVAQFNPHDRFEGYTFGGGCIYAQEGSSRITLLGGVYSDIFTYALRRGQNLKAAKARGDKATIEAYERASKSYLEAVPSWYRFCPTLFFYDIQKKKTVNISQVLEHSEHYAKADAALVELKLGHFILLGGEIKPGIRTADIVY